MNRKQRRSGVGGQLSRQEFERELRRVVGGDRSADPAVRAFWGQFTEAARIDVAIAVDDGIEVLRSKRN